MARALITGVGGQDGWYLAHDLHAAGVEVWGTTRSGQLPSDLAFVHPAPPADLRDGSSLERAVAGVRPDAIYHLAAQSSVAASWTDPVATGDISGLGTARLLEAVRRRRPSARVVVAASLEMFGEPERAPQDETTPIRPLSPYGAAKAYAYHLAHVFRRRSGLFVAVAILGNHESPRRSPAFVSAKIVRGAVAIARGEATELRLGNLAARRDWGYAADYVRALPLIVAQPDPEDFVVATGEDHAVHDWCERAFARVGLDWRDHVVVDRALWRPEGPVPLVGDPLKARRLLGWEPTVRFPDLVDLLVDAEWQRTGGGVRGPAGSDGGVAARRPPGRPASPPAAGFGPAPTERTRRVTGDEMIDLAPTIDRFLARPIKLAPRLDPKPWGGRRLATFGLPLPPGEAVGEALATDDSAAVGDGPLAGRRLGDLVAQAPAALIGERGLAVVGDRPRFPLLVKLIDAAANLSVQVHPSDALAPPEHLGKTEVYHVLAAAPGARLALGLGPGIALERFVAACRAGERTEGLLRWLPARAGETILIPAGTVHALGAGCLVYEAQQPSDVTYRFDDWGRLDAGGRPRQLHPDAGLAALDPTLRPGPIPPLPLPTPVGSRRLLAACRLFALERIALAAGEQVSVRASGSAQVLTCLEGRAELAVGVGADEAVAAAAGETVVFAAAAGTGTVRAVEPAVLLRAWVPDLRREIVDPARAAGHCDAAIAALAGPLPDLRATITD